MNPKPASPKRSISTLRSAGVWQTDLALAAWCSVCASLASYLDARPEPPPHLPFGCPPLMGVALLCAGGLILGLGVRWLFIQNDFRFVTDEESYFFLDTGREVHFCLRGEILEVREDSEGLVLVLKTRFMRIAEPPVALITVMNILARWAAQDGRPHDPPHVHPWNRGGRS